MINWAKMKSNQLEKRNDELLVDIRNLEDNRDQLEKEVRKMRIDLDTMRSRKKIEEEEVKHMIKVTLEKREIEFDKKRVEIERDAEDRISAVRKEYQVRLESQLSQQLVEAKRMYNALLDRFPDVRVMLNNQSVKED